jgi:hypothetical protein
LSVVGFAASGFCEVGGSAEAVFVVAVDLLLLAWDIFVSVAVGFAAAGFEADSALAARVAPGFAAATSEPVGFVSADGFGCGVVPLAPAD